MKLLKPVWVDSIDSTNKYWNEMIKAGNHISSGSILAAKEQYAGKGRFDRKWVVSKGENLTFSIVLKTAASFPKIATLPMAVSIGVAEYMMTKDVVAQGKWPNDILVDNKKICGILSERVPYLQNEYIIIGIGININMAEEEVCRIEKPATSLLLETGKSSVLEDELEILLPFLEKYLFIWDMHGFEGFKNKWCEIAWLYGQEVTIVDGGIEVEGILSGFGINGQLIMTLEDGQQKEFWSGDVSLKR